MTSLKFYYILPDRICEKIPLQLCQNIGYSTTCLPNFLDHFTLEHFKEELSYISFLVASNCSIYIKEFLCSNFFPKCHPAREPLMPCRSFCEYTVHNCQNMSLSTSWLFNCSRYTDEGDCYAPQINGKLHRPMKS